MVVVGRRSTMADKKKSVIPRGVCSDVWQWFVKVEPGQDGKASVKCRECGKQYAFHGGTSNLYEHLSQKHPSVLSRTTHAADGEGGRLSIKKESGTTQQHKQVLLTSFVRASVPVGRPLSTARANGLDEHLLAWLIEDLRPLNTPSG